MIYTGDEIVFHVEKRIKSAELGSENDMFWLISDEATPFLVYAEIDRDAMVKWVAKMFKKFRERRK